MSNLLKVISMCIYGEDRHYRDGLRENIRYYKLFYPDWTLRIWTDQTNWDWVQTNADSEVQVVAGEERGGAYGMFGRLVPLGDLTVGRVIFRDADSLMNHREQAAVEAWERSGLPFHTMADNLYHYEYPLMGGLWGCHVEQVPELRDIQGMIDRWGQWDRYNRDQEFLRAIVWPHAEGRILRHENRPSPWVGVPFPMHAPIRGFVGQRIFQHA